jgi:hypothetical protein
MTVIRDSEHILAAGDFHKLPGIIPSMDFPLDAISPNHDEASAISGYHIGVTGAYNRVSMRIAKFMS